MVHILISQKEVSFAFERACFAIMVLPIAIFRILSASQLTDTAQSSPAEQPRAAVGSSSPEQLRAAQSPEQTRAAQSSPEQLGAAHSSPELPSAA